MGNGFSDFLSKFWGKPDRALEASLARLSDTPGDNFEALKAVQQEWGQLARQDKEFLPRLYECYFQAIETLLNRREMNREALTSLKFVIAFSSMSYLNFANARETAWQLLGARHEEHLDLIRKALALPQERLTDRHLLTDTGLWGDIPGAMLELYYWHRPFRRNDNHDEAAAQLVPEFYRAFPEQTNSVCLNLLMLLPDASQATADMMRRHLEGQSWSDRGWAASLALDMLGYYANREDTEHKKCPEIFALTLKDAKDWPEIRLTTFIDRFILYPLNIQTPSAEEAATRLQQQIAHSRKMIAGKTYKAEMGRSAEQQRASDEKYLREYEAELALVESDFAEWNAGRRHKAVQRIAVSAGTRKALAVAVKALPAAHKPMVQALLDKAKAYANRPKKFPMPKPSENSFKDFGLKLLVIEELMYRQGVLLPKFDIREFAREYDKREISVEDDGYDIIPEVKRYFANLAIPAEQLAKVETLHQSSGLDGGARFMYHLYPFWDPGTGDEPIKVTAKAADDLALLPNLKRISGLENSKPGPTLCKALDAHGITLIAE